MWIECVAALLRTKQGKLMPQKTNDAKEPAVRIFFEDVLTRAIAGVRAKKIPVYTFAFYHDHESAAVSVCVNTKSNSARVVASANALPRRPFVTSSFLPACLHAILLPRP
jgi:hypothetical protein